MMIPILIGGAIIFAIALIVMGTRSSQPDGINERLSQFTERPLTLEELEMQQPFSQRVLIPLLNAVLAKLGQFSPKQTAEKARLNLQQAGNPYNLTPAMFSGIRLLLALVLFVLVGLVTFTSMEFTQALMYTAMAAALGFLLPGIWLGQQIKKRKHNIVKALPDALDLLTISVEAGLAFDLALMRVADKWDNELSNEFKRVLTDTRLGRARRDALKDMALRTGVEDVQTFVAAIIQAEQLGVSIGKILRIQSDQMRIRRRQRAEEAAHKAP
ncbi:MAG TPA: type II secretion system F family protein, partial [Roseiflexaceae bacterium]|nr:type II secretion system F family protein [Roseiflexaceae bacterium]